MYIYKNIHFYVLKIAKKKEKKKEKKKKSPYMICFMADRRICLAPQFVSVAIIRTTSASFCFFSQLQNDAINFIFALPPTKSPKLCEEKEILGRLWLRDRWSHINR